jgi:hypothetical protein
MSGYGVVIDTCVLYPMPVTDTLLIAAERRLFQFRWTEDLLTELHRTMTVRGHGDVAGRRINAIRRAFAETEVIGYEAMIPNISLPDLHDRHVLAAAIRSGAEVIVTFNLKDFPDESLADYGVAAVHPDNFLLGLADLAPIATLKVIHEQAHRLNRPSQTFAGLVDKLEGQTPLFAAELRLLNDANQHALESGSDSAARNGAAE